MSPRQVTMMTKATKHKTKTTICMTPHAQMCTLFHPRLGSCWRILAVGGMLAFCGSDLFSSLYYVNLCVKPQAVEQKKGGTAWTTQCMTFIKNIWRKEKCIFFRTWTIQCTNVHTSQEKKWSISHCVRYGRYGRDCIFTCYFSVFHFSHKFVIFINSSSVRIWSSYIYKTSHKMISLEA